MDQGWVCQEPRVKNAGEFLSVMHFNQRQESNRKTPRTKRTSLRNVVTFMPVGFGDY